MNNKTEEMSELVEALRAAAARATPEDGPRRVVKVGDPRNPGEEVLAAMNIIGRRPTQYVVHVPRSGIHCSADVDFIALASPENILKLLSSLPPSGPTPEPTLSMKMRGRPVAHEEAKQSAHRLINSHFGNPDKARMQIPANPADDDLIVCDYIYEQSASSVPPLGAASEAILYRPELHKELIALANKPIVQSLLYDLDLLPEQLISQKEMTIGLFAAYNRLEGVLLAFKAQEALHED